MNEQIANIFYLALPIFGFCAISLIGLCCCIKEKKKKKYTIIDEYEIIA